jgi:hypothetical protein
MLFSYRAGEKRGLLELRAVEKFTIWVDNSAY